MEVWQKLNTNSREYNPQPSTTPWNRIIFRSHEHAGVMAVVSPCTWLKSNMYVILLITPPVHVYHVQSSRELLNWI